MKAWILENDKVRVGVTEEAGHLDPVTFHTEAGDISPMHCAPWSNETLDPSLAPVLRILRGDFFCAPFGANDCLTEENRPHGATANDRWHEISKSDSHIELELAKTVLGAKVRKHVSIKPGQSVVYQHHTFTGGSGRLPLGHHAMLKASEPLLLSFSPWLWGGTPPLAIETPETEGRSTLTYPQAFSSLSEVQTSLGKPVDLSVFPTLDNSEDILMLVADENQAFSWSAATAAKAGWVWFALKNPKILPGTLLWMSNGGRDYAPWSGRHRHCLGIEEVCSYFHLGHKASKEDNELTRQGYTTTLELTASRPLTIAYIFGLISVSSDFGRVLAIKETAKGIVIQGEQGSTHVTCDVEILHD